MLHYRLEELTTDMQLSEEPNQVMQAHSEYTAIRAFAEWIEMIGKE